MKLFSKRHPEAGKDVSLKIPVRQRIWYAIQEYDPYYNPTGFNDQTMCYDDLPEHLKKEHGWQELRAYKSQTEWEKVEIQEFFLRGVPRFVLDATEIFWDLLDNARKQIPRSTASPDSFQRALNEVLEESDLPWRMLDGRVVRLDSKWVEKEVECKARELLSVVGFDGALAEFQQARADLSSGDTKGAIHGANLALESCMKCILGVDQERPGALIRKLINSGLIPEYHVDFLEAFEKHILRSVPDARNWEKGVGHGQGACVNDPPRSLAELAVNLAGVLIVFLINRHIESKPTPQPKPAEPDTEPSGEDIPF